VGESGGIDTKWERPLIEHWDGSTWQIVPSPHPNDRAAALTTSSPSGVAVLSPDNAWAVGNSTVYYRKGKRCCTTPQTRTLIEHWDGTRWRIVPNPNPSYSNPPGPRGSHRYDDLYSVAATTADNVWAVGDYWYWTPHCCHSFQSLVLHWDGSAWTQVRSDSPGGAGRNDFLYAVTVGAQNTMWAVGGFQTPSNGEQPLAEHLVLSPGGMYWQGMPAPISTPPSPQRALRAVALGGVGDIWAAGSVLTDNGDGQVPQTLLVHWDGTSWTRVTTPDSAAYAAAFYGLAALPSGDVWAVGGQ